MGGQRVEKGWTLGGQCLGYARILSEYSMLFPGIKGKYSKDGQMEGREPFETKINFDLYYLDSYF
jgi:hypothetical protein